MGNCPGVRQALCVEVCWGEWPRSGRVAPGQRPAGRHKEGRRAGKGDTLEPAPYLSPANKPGGSTAREGQRGRCLGCKAAPCSPAPRHSQCPAITSLLSVKHWLPRCVGRSRQAVRVAPTRFAPPGLCSADNDGQGQCPCPCCAKPMPGATTPGAAHASPTPLPLSGAFTRPLPSSPLKAGLL